MWDIPSVRKRVSLSDDTHDVKQLAWRPDGRALVSAGTDDTVRLWPLDEDEAVREVRARIRSW
ncbi:WD40 domain-containing protein [Lentzea sp. NPDC004789]